MSQTRLQRAGIAPESEEQDKKKRRFPRHKKQAQRIRHVSKEKTQVQRINHRLNEPRSGPKKEKPAT